MNDHAEPTERRQRDISHAQLLDQIGGRFVDLQRHLDQRLDANDSRTDRIEALQDAQAVALTSLTKSLATMEGERNVEKSMLQKAAKVTARRRPAWERFAAYGTIGAAGIAILGGLTSAAREVATLATAIGKALVATPPTH